MITNLRDNLDYYIPNPKCELDYNKDYELLLSVMLSAQTTDKRVNEVTKELYKYNLNEIASLDVKIIEDIIKPLGSYYKKALYIKEISKILLTKYNGIVPNNRKELELMPGVGRKTTNVVLSELFDIPTMAVDTHVFRVSHRIGLVPDSCTTPFSVEKELVKNIPEKLIPIAHHWLILHGRYVCQARTPKCDTCGLQMMCKYFCNTYKVTKEEPKAKNK